MNDFNQLHNALNNAIKTYEDVALTLESSELDTSDIHLAASKLQVADCKLGFVDIYEVNIINVETLVEPTTEGIKDGLIKLKAKIIRGLKYVWNFVLGLLTKSPDPKDTEKAIAVINKDVDNSDKSIPTKDQQKSKKWAGNNDGLPKNAFYFGKVRISKPDGLVDAISDLVDTYTELLTEVTNQFENIDLKADGDTLGNEVSAMSRRLDGIFKKVVDKPTPCGRFIQQGNKFTDITYNGKPDLERPYYVIDNKQDVAILKNLGVSAFVIRDNIKAVGKVIKRLQSVVDKNSSNADMQVLTDMMTVFKTISTIIGRPVQQLAVIGTYAHAASKKKYVVTRNIRKTICAV